MKNDLSVYDKIQKSKEEFDNTSIEIKVKVKDETYVLRRVDSNNFRVCTMRKSKKTDELFESDFIYSSNLYSALRQLFRRVVGVSPHRETFVKYFFHKPEHGVKDLQQIIRKEFLKEIELQKGKRYGEELRQHLRKKDMIKLGYIKDYNDRDIKNKRFER